MILPDVLAPGLIAVFCGTAPGLMSKERGAYYARPGNKFWPTLHAVGITPRRLAPEDFPELPRHGCGLTDTCKTSFGNDDQIVFCDEDRAHLETKIRAWSPRLLAFTSTRAAAAFLDRSTGDIAYGLQGVWVGATRLFVLPSPSGQAGSHWQPAPWHELGALVQGWRTEIRHRKKNRPALK